MVELAANLWADGPSSDPYEPDKSQIRAWGTWVEGIITAFTSAGGLIYASKAALDADLTRTANTMAWVLGDPVAANNGVYRKSGAAGTGGWVRMSDLPFSFIIASDVGAGTPNAIQATTSIPVSASALIWMNVAETNTGTPVTVSFNGGSALTIKTNSGSDVASGGLTSGMIVMGIVSGSVFRLVSDQASAAVVAAAEAAQVAAEAAQAAAEAAQAAAEAAAGSISPVIADLTFNIPTNYPTLQAAIDALSVRPFTQGKKIILNIESGHALTQGLQLNGGDFGNYEIRSADLLVSLAPGFVGAGPSNSLMYAEGAIAPRWNTRVDMNGIAGHGIDLRNGSFGYIFPAKGVTRASGLGADLTAGLFVENSRVHAYQSWFVNNGRNAWITVTSNAHLQSATLTGALAIGAYISRGSVASLTDADVFNAGNVGLWVNEAVVAARSGLNASNCRIGVYAVLGARVSCVSAVVTGCTNEGFYADGGWIEASDSDASGAGTFGYRVADGGQIIKTGGTGTTNIAVNGITGAGLISDSSVTATFPMLVGLDGTVTINDNWDTITMSGLYRNSSAAAVGIPVASTNWSVLHITLTGTQAAQLAMRSGANGVSYRRKASGAWQPWVTIV